MNRQVKEREIKREKTTESESIPKKRRKEKKEGR